MWFMKKEKKNLEEIAKKDLYISLEEILKHTDKGRYERVVFPPPENEFLKLQYRRMLIEEYGCAADPTGFFNVCVVHDLAQLGCFSMTPATERVQKELRVLHCLKFINIQPEIREQIPDALNFIFSEGKMENSTPPSMASIENNEES